MEFVADVIIRVKIEAINEIAAKEKFNLDMKNHSLFGVKKEVLLEPDFSS